MVNLFVPMPVCCLFVVELVYRIRSVNKTTATTKFTSIALNCYMYCCLFVCVCVCVRERERERERESECLS